MSFVLEIMGNLAFSIQNFIFEGLLMITNFLTRTTRIERIMNQKKVTPSTKVVQLEDAFRKHKDERLREFAWSSGEETEVAHGLLPSIDDEDQKHDYKKQLARSMRQIRGYTKLCDEVESRRSIPYDSKNESHEKLLLKLWRLLKPDEELKTRRTNQWQDIGFQGDDPATDFRGMGILSLEQLCFFAQFDAHNCQRSLKISLDPRIGFPFAICGITITAMLRELLYEDLLKNHFFNALKTPPTMDNFHQAYCHIFTLYCDFWDYEHPSSVMMFNLIKQKFVIHLTEYLRRGTANLFEVTLEDII
jgi:hypothetical protein